MLSRYTKLQKRTFYIKNRQTNPQEVEFNSLDCCCLNIKIIDRLRPSYTFISRLYLDHNQLISLNGIEQFQNLEILSFNFNFIANFSELTKICNPFFLKEISMIGNQLEADEKCNFEYLKNNIFKNLQCLNNPVKIKTKSNFLRKQYQNNSLCRNSSQQLVSSNNNQKQENLRFNTQIESGKTERLSGDYHANDQNTYVKYNQNELSPYINDHQEIYTKRNKREKQTTADCEQTMNMKKTRKGSGYIYEWGSKQIQNSKKYRISGHNVSLNDNIFIRPFNEFQKQHSFSNQREGNFNQDMISSQKKQNSYYVKNFEASHGWKIKDRNSDNDSNFMLESIDKHNIHAFQFLQSQKEQISEAFYHRTLKQKIFAILKHQCNRIQNQSSQYQQKSQSNKYGEILYTQQQQNKKKKAFAALKIFTNIQNLYRKQSEQQQIDLNSINSHNNDF